MSLAHLFYLLPIGNKKGRLDSAFIDLEVVATYHCQLLWQFWKG